MAIEKQKKQCLERHSAKTPQTLACRADILMQATARPFHLWDSVDPIVHSDGFAMTIRASLQSVNTSIYWALGVNTNRRKDFLGPWLPKNEAAPSWFAMLIERKCNAVTASSHFIPAAMPCRERFPKDAPARKRLAPASGQTAKNWTMPISHRRTALRQFLLNLATDFSVTKK